MKLIARIFMLLSLVGISVIVLSCEEYLDKNEASDISEMDVFGNFKSFQGFVEIMYSDIMTLEHHRDGTSWNWGDDIVVTPSVVAIEDGNYRAVLNSNNYPFLKPSIRRDFSKPGGEVAVSYWKNGWAGIRTANLALAKLDLLVDATQEERNLIQGQAYFFRGFFHWEIMKAWGSVPYVDMFLAPDSDLKIPQLSFHETAEKVVTDLQKAADLLPINWDATVAGNATAPANIGRITKGMAHGIMAEVLLYCGSPLMNGVSTGSYTYHTDYLKRAAEAAWKVLELANAGHYSLQPWDKYSDIFYRENNTIPGGDEIVFRTPHRGYSRYKTQMMLLSSFGGGSLYGSPTQNYVELFETASGLPIDDPESGFNEMDPWNNRDPRFRYNIYIDRDKMAQTINDARAIVQFYVGGRDRGANNTRTGYGYKKFLGLRANNYDNWSGGSNNYHFIIHRLRLAEIYLFYAEAVNEAYGPNGSHPGANLTAVQAVNIIRSRAQMPSVHAKFTSSKETFRERIRVERAVELAYEGQRWYDLRRWYVAHLDQYRDMYALEFDADHTYFRKVLYKKRPFESKHYWLPFPNNQVNLYKEWKQNSGW
jgi:starch-binding outer membrane protein, SusD/RagB family